MNTTDLDFYEEELDFYEEELELEESTLYNENLNLLQNFKPWFKIHQWKTNFVYWYKEPKHTKRLTDWIEISDAFLLHEIHKKHINNIFNNCDWLGQITKTNLNNLFPSKNRGRVLHRLIKKDILQHIPSKDIYRVNPCIIYARDWFSPATQALMLVTYMNKEHVPEEIAKKLTKSPDKIFFQFGLDIYLEHKEEERKTKPLPLLSVA